MLKITDIYNLKDIYKFHFSFQTPYFFEVDYDVWKKSFECDTDGQGKVLFKELEVKTVYDDGELLGFVQYGRTAFGFDKNDFIREGITRSYYTKQEN